MNKERDDAQIADQVEEIRESAAESMPMGARDRMREAVKPKIKEAVAQREAMVDAITREPVKGAPSDPSAADSSRITITDVRQHAHVNAYLEAANANLKILGYTEHGRRHASLVGHIAANVLRHLGYGAREIELAEIAGFLHDIGNSVNREQHGQTGAVLANHLLLSMGMPINEVVTVIGAIGNHEEERGHAVSTVAAAVILADKSDVHRSRVQNEDPTTFDIHDRVNYAATRSFLRVENGSARTITLELTIDAEMASVMDYFEIFLSRMIMCRRAAEFLGAAFLLRINDVPIL